MMLKKITFILFSIAIAIIINWFRVHNGNVIINFVNYQVITTTNFILCCFVVIIIVLYFITFIKNFIFRPENLKKKIELYTDNVAKSFIYATIKDIKNADKFFKKSDRIFNNNLTKLLNIYILNNAEKYKQIPPILNALSFKDFDLDVLQIKIDLENAKTNGDTDAIEKSANKMLLINPSDVFAIKDLVGVYITNREWSNAYKIYQRGLKLKILKKQDEYFLILKNLGQKYYDDSNFEDAKIIFKELYFENTHNQEVVNSLAKTYIALDKKYKAVRIIEKVWKHITNETLLNTYFLANNDLTFSVKLSRKLYVINSKSFESNYALARAYYFNRDYVSAKKYAMNAEKISQRKIIYELLLNIAKDSNDTITTNLFKNKLIEKF